MAAEDRSFRDFYPDYLAEHRNPVSPGGSTFSPSALQSGGGIS
jgi:hypothetical protein